MPYEKNLEMMWPGRMANQRPGWAYRSEDKKMSGLALTDICTKLSNLNISHDLVMSTLLLYMVVLMAIFQYVRTILAVMPFLDGITLTLLLIYLMSLTMRIIDLKATRMTSFIGLSVQKMVELEVSVFKPCTFTRMWWKHRSWEMYEPTCFV